MSSEPSNKPDPTRNGMHSPARPTKPLTRGVETPRGIRVGQSWAYILAFALVAALLAAFVGYRIESSYQSEMAHWKERQTSVAYDRAQRVAEWLSERQADAELFSTRPSIRAALSAHHGSRPFPSQPRSGQPGLTAILNQMARQYRYSGIYLLDRDARVVAQSSHSEPLSPALAEVSRTAGSGKSVRIDLLGDAPEKTLISFSVPVFPEPGRTGGGRTPSQALGVALLVSHASETLFRLVTREGIPTRTGETLLVRREGNDVVFFSPLRDVPAHSPNLRFPLSKAPLPARTALEGHEVHLASTDYQGVAVLAATRRILLTGWGLVRKIDRSEALEDFYRQTTIEGVAAALLLVLLGGVVISHRRHVVTRILEHEEKKFRSLLESAPDSMVVADTQGGIVLANLQAERQFGYTRAELLGQSIETLVPERARSEHRAEFHRHATDLSYQHSGPCGVSLGLRKDGSEFPIEVLITPLQSPEGTLLISAIRDITERKRAEEELRRLNRALRTLSECNQAMVRAREEPQLVKDVCRILVNEGDYRLAWVGYAEQDEAKSVRPVAHAGVEEGYLETLKLTWDDSGRGRGPTGTAIRTGKPQMARNIREDPQFAPWRDEALRRGYNSSIALPLSVDGRRIGALMLYSPSVDSFDDQEVELLTELAHDLGYGIQGLRTRAEREQAELALRKSKAALEEAQRIAHLGTWDWDIATNELWWSDEVFRIFGLTPQTFGGTNEAFLASVHPSDRDFVSQSVTDALHTLRPYSIDHRVIRPDGSERVVHEQAQVFFNDSRQPVRMVGTVQDITERKHAEETLLRLRQAVDTSGEVVFMTDRDGTFTFVNPEFTRLYGYAKDEVVGKATPSTLRCRNTDPGDWEGCWKTMVEGRPAVREIVNETKDGKVVIVECSGNPILDEQGNTIGFLAIQRDVTARKQLEDQLRQAQKMEAIGRLAGGVAHDFNNLLTIIAGYGQLLFESLPEKDPLRTQVTEVLKASERATALTRQLLAFGRRQVLAPRVLDLNEVIADTEKMLRRLIGEDIELVTVRGRGLGRVKADPGQIEQVILNLAVNARDAMPEGGRLTIETSEVLLDEAYASQHLSVEPGAYVMLAVSDTGRGMDPDTQAHMFEPFFTTKEKGKGTGLGLSTVYGIVKQSGGYIWVYSEVGQGTTFKVYLPKIQEAVEATPAPRVESASRGGTETILLVEDDSSVRSLVQAMLEPRGYRLLVAGNGGDALLLCEQHKGPIHLLLTDVVMPGMSGRELAERLSPLHREMKVLYMSGYTDNAIVHHGVLDANVKFLQKPFSPPALAGKVRAVLDGAG